MFGWWSDTILRPEGRMVVLPPGNAGAFAQRLRPRNSGLFVSTALGRTMTLVISASHA